jgi:hypothetical protein
MSPFINAYKVNKLPAADENLFDLQNNARPKNAYPTNNGKLDIIALDTFGIANDRVLPSIEYYLVVSIYLIKPIQANIHPNPIGSSLLTLTKNKL